MVDSLKVQVALDGSEEVQKQFADIAAAATRVFGVVAVAVAAAGAALVKYTSQAAEVADQLGRLADLSGKAMESVSALSTAFAQGGTDVKKFASEFTALEQKVQEAAASMGEAVAASSQRIVKAQQSVAQSALSVQGAELGLQEARLAARKQLFGERPDVQTSKNIADARAQLAVAEAQQRVAAARAAQQEAAHALRVAEANDLEKNIALYQQMGAGAKVAFDPLTTQATKNAALLGALAQAGTNWKFVLADILKNATELERIQIGKALGLDPATLDTLKQGSEALRAQKKAVEDLGLALDDVDRNRLRAFSQSWAMLGATATAALEKLGAALAPLGTLIAQGLTAALVGLIQFVQTTAREFEALGSIINTVATVGAGVIGAMVEPVLVLGRAVAWVVDKFLELVGLQSRAGGTPLAGGAPIGGPGGGIGSAAGGGLLGGRGTGTSDSNLAWVSRGEYVTPARAVARPGVLMFLEALRRSGGNLSAVLNGMGRFALGGMVPRAMPAFASGGLSGGNNVTIQFPGLQPIGGLRASSAVVAELRRSAALAQVRSGGRKPSRYA